MYHYITLGDTKIFLTWIGIMLFLATFLVSTKYYCQKYNLNFSTFFRFVPQSILITYLLGTYSRYLIESFIVFPTDPQQRLLYLTPAGYTFHFVGIIIWIFVCAHRFFRRVVKPEQRHLRVEVFFHSLMWALIPLGVCLLMGDNFIGKQTNGGIYVSAIRSDSAVAIYDKVIPLGLYLSILWLAGHFFTKLLDSTYTKRWRKWWRWYFAFGIFLIALSILLLRQQYPRHIVMQIAWISIDIKQYLAWILAWFFLYKSNVIHLPRLNKNSNQ